MSAWSKLFQNWQWHNGETATDTPINATNLQKINDAIDGIDDRVLTLQQDEGGYVKKTGDTMSGALNINSINGSSSDLHLQSSANNDIVLEAINGDDEPVGAVIISNDVTVEETLKVADLADDTVALEMSAEAVSGDVRGKIRFKYDDGEDVQHEDIYIDSDGVINVSEDMKINGDLCSTGAVKTDRLLPNTANTALDVNGLSVSNDDNGRIEISPESANDTLALISSDTVEIESADTLSLTSTGSDIEISADDAVDIDGSVVNVTADNEVDVQDIRFVKALPTAHVSCVGAMYFLTNDQTGYTKGEFYECVASGQTYSWQLYSGDYMRKGVDYVTAGRRSGTTVGLRSTAEGIDNTASGMDSHAEGNDTIASGASSHSGGYQTTASGSSSTAIGNNTTASNSNAVSEGENTIASGRNAHSCGIGTIANSKNQLALGKYNTEDTPDPNTGYGDYAFIIGNGTGNNARSNAFGVKWTGETVINGDVVIGQHYDSTQSADVDSNLTVSGIVTVNGSDYAEKFEEAEPCPVNRFVTLDGEKIRLAQPNDDYILGVTSEKPAIVGDKDNDGVAVGLIGKLWVVHDGSAKVNGFVVSGANGIATDKAFGYRVMAVDGNRCKILVK